MRGSSMADPEKLRRTSSAAKECSEPQGFNLMWQHVARTCGKCLVSYQNYWIYGARGIFRSQRSWGAHHVPWKPGRNGDDTHPSIERSAQGLRRVIDPQRAHGIRCSSDDK